MIRNRVQFGMKHDKNVKRYDRYDIGIQYHIYKINRIMMCEREVRERGARERCERDVRERCAREMRERDARERCAREMCERDVRERGENTLSEQLINHTHLLARVRFARTAA